MNYQYRKLSAVWRRLCRLLIYSESSEGFAADGTRDSSWWGQLNPAVRAHWQPSATRLSGLLVRVWGDAHRETADRHSLAIAAALYYLLNKLKTVW